MDSNDNFINSKQYWDNRFNTDWEGNSGRQQTLYFCDLAISAFPDWLHYLLEQGATFADVGCAEGDGTHFFAERYPNSEFTGIDFSEAAIKKANNYYPDQNFIQAEIQNIDSRYDVVFSSNTLEHFINPFEMLKHLFRISEKYTVILIPFQEYERFKEHFYTFDYKDFHIHQFGFTIVHAQEIDCGRKENIYWAGKQLLVIYARENLVSKHNLTLYNYINTLSIDYSEARSELNVTKNQLTETQKSFKQYGELLLKQQDEMLVQTKLIEQMNQALDQYRKEKEGLLQEVEQLEQNLSIVNLQNENMQQEKKDLISALMISNKNESSLEKELSYSKEQIEWLLKEKYNADIELQSIKSSTLWAVGKRYYAFRDKTPIIKDIFKALRILRRQGFKTLCKKIYYKMKFSGKNEVRNKSLDTLYDTILKKINSKELDGVVIIPSAFEFKDLFNQRTINLAKHLSLNNKAVIFVVWQWSKDELINRNCEEVYSNVFQVSLYDYYENLNLLDKFKECSYKKAILNIPSKIWMEILFGLKVKNFEIIYDVMDDWEEFNKVGEASWYQKELEEAFVLNSDRVYAVSETLVRKFQYLRQDIVCVGNGYYPDLLGVGNRNIASKNNSSDENVIIGYVGHLTDSWFDWDLIEQILQKERFHVEIIGYGVKEEILDRLKRYPNFKYLGKVEPQHLHKYIAKWNIGLIPFKDSKLSNAVDPIKVYEYIYFGLKVVVTGIPHLKTYPNVYYFDRKDEALSISSLIEEIHTLEESDELKDEIGAFLENTTWDKRFDQMLDNKINCYSEIYNYETN
ncbi:methyltransferase domain-containing protein [Paenibacillus macerans]|uniref:methyltransferase domain-containing protein n=1 Tax=Paenibacillus macerans TaxID=44252 RepID=UPI0022DFE967|nr:methyltransferase domain-containing protein [Paenibacillus macerans]